LKESDYEKENKKKIAERMSEPSKKMGKKQQCAQFQVGTGCIEDMPETVRVKANY